MSVAKMISLHPDVDGNLNEALATAIRHSMFCAAICTSCADACLAEEMVAKMRECIRKCLDCADVCTMTFHVATRRAASNEGVLRRALELCVAACETCAAECERHDNDHCAQCATMCRECADDCRKAITTF